jgi:hypothetical protein
MSPFGRMTSRRALHGFASNAVLNGLGTSEHNEAAVRP